MKPNLVVQPSLPAFGPHPQPAMQCGNPHGRPAGVRAHLHPDDAFSDLAACTAGRMLVRSAKPPNGRIHFLHVALSQMRLSVAAGWVQASYATVVAPYAIHHRSVLHEVRRALADQHRRAAGTQRGTRALNKRVPVRPYRHVARSRTCREVLHYVNPHRSAASSAAAPKRSVP